MQLEGSLYVANAMIAQFTVEEKRDSLRFSKQLESCLLQLCRELDVPIPLWLEKNTKEFARFHQTVFFRESYAEPVKFDRFRIRWLDDFKLPL